MRSRLPKDCGSRATQTNHRCKRDRVQQLMTTEKQILPNRRNGGQSAGPRTELGKRRSHQNAFRHGLTAETVIANSENAQDYAEFEQAIIADYQPITAIEYQLVMRLASLLWRLRRTVAIESGLFALQGHNIRNRRLRYRQPNRPVKIFRDLLDPPQPHGNREPRDLLPRNPLQASSPALDLAYSFLRLVNVNNSILERISRYEGRLWRQVAQTLVLLESFRKGLARTIRDGGY